MSETTKPPQEKEQMPLWQATLFALIVAILCGVSIYYGTTQDE